jgi:MFS family permease
MTNTSSATLFSEPIRKVPARWIALFATGWLGIWMAQLTPIQLLLPKQVASVSGFPLEVADQLSGDWFTPVVAFGVISGIAGLAAIFAYPMTGALSDRTTSRFGRRKPWIFSGALLFAVSLFLLGIQQTIIGVGAFWALSLVGFCMLTASLTAMISDQVPVNQRGFVSGWVSAPQAAGTILGILLVTELSLSIFVGYAVSAALLIVLVVPFLLFSKDAVLSPADRPELTARALFSGLWVSPRKYPDFGWTLLSRILVNVGNALGTTLLLYFLAFGLRRGATAEEDLLALSIIYMAFFILSSLIVGRISDRIGQRKVFVYVAAYLQAIAAALLAFVPEYSIAMVGAALLGLGYGSFMAVDQALATQVLPDAHSRGKDLGIMNIASAVPQAFGPLLGSFIVYLGVMAATGSGSAVVVGQFAGAATGFTSLFVASAVAAVLGGLAIYPIKSVK